MSPCCETPRHSGAATTNEVNRTNILAPGVRPDPCRNHLLPAFTVPSVAAPNAFGAQPKSRRRHACHYNDWPSWEVVSSYSSATAPDSHGISCADPLFQARKELDPEVAACVQPCKNYFGFILPVRLRTFGQVQQLSLQPKGLPPAWQTPAGSRCVSLPY